MRREQHLFSGPPVPGVDLDVTDFPASIIHEEVLDMTDLAVAGVDMASGDRCDATEMRIARIGVPIDVSEVMWARLRFMEWRDEWCQYGVTHIGETADPIRIPAVIV